MHEKELLQEILEYIDTHLQEEITLRRISDAVCYSDEYVCRYFRKNTGMNLFDYIRKKRLIFAAAELQRSKGRILDLALTMGYNSHEGFTRAFTSHFGHSPKDFRDRKPGIPLFMPVIKRLTAIKEFTLESITIFTQVIDRPQRKFLYLKGKVATEYYAYCEEVGCDIWGRLLEIKPALYEPVGAWLPENLRPENCSRYVQGVEVAMEFPDEKAMDLDCMILGASKYLVFHTVPYECDEEDKNMMETIGQT